MAISDEFGFPTFAKFMDAVNAARYDEFSRRLSATTVGAEEFAAMTQYIRDLYAGIEVAHSFVDDNGQVFDCIPIASQPALRGVSEGPAAPPDAPPGAESGGDSVGELIQPQLRSDRLDKFGHPMSCPPGTIAMRRITLEELARHGSLRNFFQKSPGGGRHPRLSPLDSAASVHKYAHAHQTVNNLGGSSFVNVWAPKVGSQVFSLTQQWFAGGSPEQTVECGAQVYPAKYGTIQPVLFIYWTADGYKNTGCYNLECSAFVQTSSAWAIGGTLSPVSIPHGAQREIEVTWYLNSGKWWLYLDGTNLSNAVGYYPTSLFRGGQLASSALDIDFGGEVDDVTAWPPMGSGEFAKEGLQIAAYQRNVGYFPTGGGYQLASLTASQPSPNCFTTALGKGPMPWNVYFFFGGPGGTACT
ncbi:hypothetical protein P3T37_006171 [Kitasatospora sp. MAA4]|uniref:neprosin family prolyl endopeptidase n=1 Tax=Kitasatospora sp. MAA4 TaxID=3035093 RepID=UPI0024755015|nr:neprosin family prolyl endopeptidase [Kitasatospora sp. MAA4]MDH6136740.1 hypothetical protein [Kitasatospora sp. MAA4]